MSMDELAIQRALEAGEPLPKYIMQHIDPQGTKSNDEIEKQLRKEGRVKEFVVLSVTGSCDGSNVFFESVKNPKSSPSCKNVNVSTVPASSDMSECMVSSASDPRVSIKHTRITNKNLLKQFAGGKPLIFALDMEAFVKPSSSSSVTDSPSTTPASNNPSSSPSFNQALLSFSNSCRAVGPAHVSLFFLNSSAFFSSSECSSFLSSLGSTSKTLSDGAILSFLAGIFEPKASTPKFAHHSFETTAVNDVHKIVFSTAKTV